MNFKLIKNIALFLCIGLIYLSNFVSSAYAQLLPQNNELTRINELAQWTPQGQKKAEEEAAKKKQETTVPESIAQPKSSQEVLNELTPWSGYATSKTACEGEYQPANVDAGTTPNAAGLFSDDLMQKMQIFMREIYKELSKVFMIGHSLLCYSQKVAYLCLGLENWTGCWAKLVNLNLFISGLIIYIVGVLMTMSIGMYFVDISFKLGFAMVFMPVSIALWPFPPTKNKFQENLSIIIRNGMLFTLVAIGVTFTVTLVSNSLLDTGDGRDGWEAFWKAIADKKTETLIDNFAFDRMHFLVVAFGLIFGFKILASSVNDYLDYFFSDSVFGSESPMHHMGTQAVGMVAANTVKPAASFVGDVAKTQTGRAIAGLGGGIAALGSKEGRAQLAGGVKKFASAVTNPRRTYNNAMGKLGEKTNQAVQGVGSLVKGFTNVGLLFSFTKDSTRREVEKRWDDKIDKAFKKAGNWAEDKVAHGGGQLQNAAADAAAAGINLYNKQVLGKDNPNDIITRDDVKGAINQSFDSVKGDLKAAGKGIKTGARNMAAGAAAAVYNTGQMMAGNPENMKTGDDIVEDLKTAGKNIKSGAQNMATNIQNTTKNAVAGAAATVYNDIQSLKNTPENVVTTEAMRMFMGEEKRKLAQATKEAWKDADKSPISLQPSALLSAPFKIAESLGKGVRHPINSAINNVNKLANGWEALKKAKEDKVILKKTGQVVLRTAARTVKGTGQDIKRAAEGTASIFGNVLKDFGQSLQNNESKSGHKWTSWQDIHDAEERKKEASQEDRDYFKSINTYDDD
ncbi:MAG: hypothetical protein IJ677_03320 [Alphaproteobacteria bacterium]|nr:hypothetical protein [Alphaproteobacteria bacterium]